MTGTSPGNSGRLATRGPKIRPGPVRPIPVDLSLLSGSVSELVSFWRCPLNIYVRSNLAAATVAVVGAGTIAFAPVLPGAVDRVPDLPPLTAAQVVLTADAIALTDFRDTLATVIQTSLKEFGARLGPALGQLLGSLIPFSLIGDLTGGIVGGTSALVFHATGQVFGYTRDTIHDLIFGSQSILAVSIRAILAIPAKTFQSLTYFGQDPLESVRQIGAAIAAPVTDVTARLHSASESERQFIAAEITSVLKGLPGVIFDALGAAITKNSASMTDALVKFVATLFPNLDIPVAASVAVTPSALVAPTAAAPRPAAARHSVAAASVAPAIAPADPVDSVKPVEPSVTVGDQAEPAAPVTARSRSAVSKAAHSDAAQPKSVSRSRAGVRHVGKTAPASDASEASDVSAATPAG